MLGKPSSNATSTSERGRQVCGGTDRRSERGQKTWRSWKTLYCDCSQTLTHTDSSQVTAGSCTSVLLLWSLNLWAGPASNLRLQWECCSTATAGWCHAATIPIYFITAFPEVTPKQRPLHRGTMEELSIRSLVDAPLNLNALKLIMYAGDLTIYSFFKFYKSA